MRVAVLTDSTSGLTSYRGVDAPALVVPLTVALGDIVYTDGIDLTAATFYSLLANQQAVATTAQPPPALFDDAFSALANDGYDAIVAVLCAKVLSGTVDSAREAARRASVDVTVVDTAVIGAALGLSVRAAVLAAQSGADADVVAHSATTVAQASRTFFVVDDLDHLRRGGRLKATQAALGQALKVKPLLQLDPQGHVELAQRSRTWQRALEQLAARANAHFQGPVHAVIAHADAADRAVQLEQHLADVLTLATVEYDVIGPVVGAHVGRGAAGVALVPAPLWDPSSTGR